MTPTPRPRPTCPYCGQPFKSEIELHRTASSGGIMRVNFRPCQCARAKGERQRVEMRKGWLGRAAGRLATVGGSVAALGGVLRFTEAVALGGLLVLVALTLWAVSFAASRGSTPGPKRMARVRRRPPGPPLPDTRRPSGAP